MRRSDSGSMAPPVIAVVLGILAVVLAYIGATQVGVCNGGFALLYWAAADAAAASVLALLGQLRIAAVCGAGFVGFLAAGLVLLSGAGCPV